MVVIGPPVSGEFVSICVTVPPAAVDESIPPESSNPDPILSVFRCKVASPKSIPDGEVVPVPPWKVVNWAKATKGKISISIINSFFMLGILTG